MVSASKRVARLGHRASARPEAGVVEFVAPAGPEFGDGMVGVLLGAFVELKAVAAGRAEARL